MYRKVKPPPGRVRRRAAQRQTVWSVLALLIALSLTAFVCAALLLFRLTNRPVPKPSNTVPPAVQGTPPTNTVTKQPESVPEETGLPAAEPNISVST